jgi:rapamycin-insensitive companion of mTOR
MLYRALHTISTSKYKQPVRRYILDLFDLQLDPETVQNVATAGKRLRSPEVNGTQKSTRPNNPRVFSIIRPRRHVDIDEDSDSSGDELGPPPVPAPQKAARTLRPMSRIVGFAQ